MNAISALYSSPHHLSLSHKSKCFLASSNRSNSIEATALTLTPADAIHLNKVASPHANLRSGSFNNLRKSLREYLTRPFLYSSQSFTLSLSKKAEQLFNQELGQLRRNASNAVKNSIEQGLLPEKKDRQIALDSFMPKPTFDIDGLDKLISQQLFQLHTSYDPKLSPDMHAKLLKIPSLPARTKVGEHFIQITFDTPRPFFILRQCKKFGDTPYISFFLKQKSIQEDFEKWALENNLLKRS